MLESTNSVLIDFAIVTAVTTEREAVCAAFEFGRDKRINRESRVYWRGRLQLEEGQFYEIVVVQSSDAANVDATLVTNDTIHHWHPGALLLVGFAAAAHDGSLPDHENLGDVIIASDVYYYERGKETDKGKLPEPQMFKANSTLWSRVKALPRWTTPILASRPDSKRQRPITFEAVIASGERVIASEAVRNEIRGNHRKIRAIEMEGYGFSKAAWQSFENTPYLVFKSICDRADVEKSDNWQPYAAAAAASFAKHFLLDQPLEPRNPPETEVCKISSRLNQGGPKRTKSIARKTRDWEVDLPRIDYNKAISGFEFVLSKIEAGGAAMLLWQESYLMGGKWGVAQIKKMLKEDSRKFRYCPIVLLPHETVDETQVMLSIGRYLNVKVANTDLNDYTRIIIDRICESFQIGSTLFLDLRIRDDLSRNDNFLAWLVKVFWRPLVEKIRTLIESVPLIRCVFLISADGTLARSSLRPSLVNRHAFSEGKILELQLEKWTVEEIRTWLYKFSDLSLGGTEYEQLAKLIHQNSQGGLPLAVYGQLLEHFQAFQIPSV